MTSLALGDVEKFSAPAPVCPRTAGVCGVSSGVPRRSVDMSFKNWEVSDPFCRKEGPPVVKKGRKQGRNEGWCGRCLHVAVTRGGK